MADTTYVARGVKFRIFPRKDRPGSQWLIYYQGSKRIRETIIGDRAAATKRARELAPKLTSGDEALRLPTDQQRACVRALEILAPLNKPVDSVAREFASAMSICSGHASLEEMARSWVKHSKMLPNRSVAEVVTELMESVQELGRSKVRINELKGRLEERFVVSFGTKLIQDVKTQDLNKWLTALRVKKPAEGGKKMTQWVKPAPRTINNYIEALQRLFHYAKNLEYLDPSKKTEADKLELRTDPAQGGAVSIFSQDQFSMLLANASDKLLPCLAIGGFAGLRNAEVSRLQWESVRWASGVIVVPKEISKAHRNASRRTVPIQPALAAYLSRFRKHTGPVSLFASPGSLCRAQSALAKRLGLDWEDNGLRHSYGSYRLTEVKSAQQVSLEMGNSPEEVFACYNELVMPEEAKAYWALRPVKSLNE